jgi:hypothetical protein
MAARSFVVGNDAILPKFATPEGAKIGSQNSLLRRYVGREKGHLPGKISEIAAREMVKLQLFAQSATLLADWRRVDPRSEALLALLKKLRRKPMADGPISDERLAILGRLLGGQPLVDLEANRSLARAKRISEFYLLHYYHAVPFDRGVLRAAWSNCSVNGCRKAQDQVEKLLGKIGAPRRGDIPLRRSGPASPVPDEATDATDLSSSPPSS